MCVWGVMDFPKMTFFLPLKCAECLELVVEAGLILFGPRMREQVSSTSCDSLLVSVFSVRVYI